MTEFTAEFIEEQRKIIRNGTMTVLQMKGNNEIDLHINMMYRRAKQEHCEKYYPEALDHIERLQARVQELEQERRWIPVSERMPNSQDGLNFDGTIDVLVYIKLYKKVIEANYYPKMSVWNMPYGWGDETDNITHWTTRLQPPQEGE